MSSHIPRDSSGNPSPRFQPDNGFEALQDLALTIVTPEPVRLTYETTLIGKSGSLALTATDVHDAAPLQVTIEDSVGTALAHMRYSNKGLYLPDVSFVDSEKPDDGALRLARAGVAIESVLAYWQDDEQFDATQRSALGWLARNVTVLEKAAASLNGDISDVVAQLSDAEMFDFLHQFAINRADTFIAEQASSYEIDDDAELRIQLERMFEEDPVMEPDAKILVSHLDVHLESFGLGTLAVFHTNFEDTRYALVQQGNDKPTVIPQKSKDKHEQLDPEAIERISSALIEAELRKFFAGTDGEK